MLHLFRSDWQTDVPSGNSSLQSSAETLRCPASLNQATAFHSSLISCPSSSNNQLNTARVRWRDEYSWTWRPALDKENVSNPEWSSLLSALSNQQQSSLRTHLSQRNIGGGCWTLCRLQPLQKSSDAAVSFWLLWNPKLLLPHVSHSVLEADVPLTQRHPRVTGDAGLRFNLGVRQHRSQQLGDAEVQPVDLKRVETSL